MCDVTGPTPVQLSLRLADERGDRFEALVWGGLIANLTEPDGISEQAAEPGVTEWVISWLDPPPDQAIERLVEALRGMGATEISLTTVALDAGLDGWREHAREWRAGPFVVRPPWVEPTSGGGTTEGAIDLVIDPGAVFGSGSHQSTRLALELLSARFDDAERAGGPLGVPDEVIDVGSGSGVLGIAAASLDSGVVRLVELDPVGEQVGLANAAANGVADRVRWAGTDVAKLDAPEAEAARLVLANLLIGEHESVASSVRRMAGVGGTVIVAGILERQEDRLLAALAPTVPLKRLVEPSETDPTVAWVALTLLVTDPHDDRSVGEQA
jgi:ribosomal protein L11 methyltransferase